MRGDRERLSDQTDEGRKCGTETELTGSHGGAQALMTGPGRS